MVFASNLDPFGLKMRNVDVIEKSYQYLSMSPETLTDLHVDNAFAMMNKIIKQWTNPFFMQMNEVLLPVKLINECAWYPLPPEILNVYDVTVRTARRYREGSLITTAYGNPEYAFDNNIDTIFEQLEPNGAVIIGFDKPVMINCYGVLSGKDAYYRLKISGSNTNTPNSWVELNDTGRQLPFSGEPSVMNTRWFTILIPQSFLYYKIEETGGEILWIREIYLEKFNISRPISSIGRSTYQQITTPNQIAQTSICSIQKANNRINLQLWGSPSNVDDEDTSENSSNYNFLYVRGSRFPFDFKSMLSNVDINGRFIGTFIDHLACELAGMYKQDLYDLRKKIADESLQKARMQDNDLGGLQFTNYYN